MAHRLAPLPYDYAALEPFIDAQTMQLHHDKHHAAYVNNLNNALADYPDWQAHGVEDLVKNLEQVPEAIRAVVRNNAGGHLNHTMFWQSMAPSQTGEPTGAIAQAIANTFGSFDAFKQQFNEVGTKLFGSGWVWLVLTRDRTLRITTTPNQDSPLTQGETPLLGNDVWEHAYYLKYQNRRLEYLSAWWNVVNWDEVNRRFQVAHPNALA
ncbi:MAG: superoxide dismutase [Oscillatoriales cyanobacterium C42_A2020_001]|nr:superoxide dismutase [Leptolyngbyaceae cyanobacterium C42_A2020_001]